MQKAAKQKRHQRNEDSATRMLRLRDAISQLIEQRDELYHRSIEQGEQIKKLRQRVRILDEKRSQASSKIKHLLQQLPQ